jgi:methionyl-tRNA formyltransferase
LRILYMGTPEFAIPPLQHILLEGHQIVAVYTPPDKPAGRGRNPAPPPLKTAGFAWGLLVIQVPSLKSGEALERIAALRPECIVVAAFGQILPQAVLDIPRHGCINIHPSLLPRYRGSMPVAASILAGDIFTGVSIMRMDAGLDTGPIYSQAQIPVSAGDTTGSLTAKLSQVSARMLPEVLAGVSSGKLSARPQSRDGANYFGELKKEEGRIDWHDTADSIGRRVRAFQPWPGAFTHWQRKQLKILEAVPLFEKETFEAGRVIELSKEAGTSFGVAAVKGVVGVRKIQMEGKRAMSAEEFLRGQPGILGAVLD